MSIERLGSKPFPSTNPDSNLDWGLLEGYESERRARIIRKLGETALEVVRKIFRKPDDIKMDEPVPTLARLDASYWYRHSATKRETADANQRDGGGHEAGIVTEPEQADFIQSQPIQKQFDTGQKNELEGQMWYRGEADSNKKTRLRNQRAQEMFERDLNATLTTTEQLVDAIEAGEEGIRGYNVAYKDTSIPVISLEGFPFAMLTHCVDYRAGAKGTGIVGSETYQKVMDNPRLWVDSREQVEADSHFGTNNADARGDVISASYTNSEHNLTSRVNGSLTYGFCEVEADSVIYVRDGDAGTINNAGKNDTSVSLPDYLGMLEGPDATDHYNEVLLRRYSETGKAKRPDYILVENGNINETALRHAEFFGIPIISIETDIYRDRQYKRGREILDSISESDSYQDLEKKIEELLSLSMCRRKYPLNERQYHIGNELDFLPNTNTQDEDLIPYYEAAKLERVKRLEFITSTLEALTDDSKSPEDRDIALADFISFDVRLYDVENNLLSDKDGDKGNFYAPGNRSEIRISFRLKNTKRVIETHIWDGEHVVGLEKLPEGPRESCLKWARQSNSDYYDRLLPLVKGYFAAYRTTNTEFKTT